MCSCIPPPASLRPRKTYNLLVPDVFASSTVPDIAEPTSASIRNKIGKLQEYVSKNPGKAGKVSRRLTRRIKKALYDHQLGYVRVAVEAYCELLKGSQEERSTYTFSYFNKELVHQPDAMISGLLSYQRAEIQALGADLLAAYTQAQSPVEHQAQPVAELVGRVLRLCSPSGPAADSTNTATGELRESCLTVLGEYVHFCQRLKILPQLLEQIEVGLLDQLESDFATGIDIRSSASEAVSKAGSILGNFKPFLQDTSSVRRVVGTLLQWLDKNNRWENSALVQSLVGLVHDACSGITYPLTSSLLRHCASERVLTPKQRALVARLAVQQDSVYSLSAFNLAMLELPRALVAAHKQQQQQQGATPSSDLQELHQAASEVCVSLAHQVGHAGQVCEAIASVLRGQLTSSIDTHTTTQPYVGGSPTSPTSPTTTGSTAPNSQGSLLRRVTLECGLAVVRSLPQLPEQGCHLTGRVLPAALLSTLSSAVGPGKHRRPSSLGATGPWMVDLSMVRGLAVQLLAALLPSLNGPLKDDRQALQLLSVVATAAAQLSVTGPDQTSPTPPEPTEVVASTQLIHGALQSQLPQVQLQAARTALYLGQQAGHLGQAASGDGGAKNPATAMAAVSVALMAQSAMHQVAVAVQCPGLLKIKVFSQPPLLELTSTPGHTLDTTATSWSVSAQSYANEAVAKEGTLKHEWGTGLLPLLETPLHSAHATSSSGKSPVPPLSPAGSRPLPGDTAGPAGMASERSWVSRQVSIRKERLNIARVIDILGGEEEEEEVDSEVEVAQAVVGTGHRSVDTAGKEAAVDLVDVALRSKPGVPLVTAGTTQPPLVLTNMQDVIKLAAREAAAAEAAGAGVPTHAAAGLLSPNQLIAQLEPLTSH